VAGVGMEAAIHLLNDMDQSDSLFLATENRENFA